MSKIGPTNLFVYVSVFSMIGKSHTYQWMHYKNETKWPQFYDHAHPVLNVLGALEHCVHWRHD